MKGTSDCTIFIVQMFECYEQCYIKQTFKANCLHFHKYHVHHDTKQKSNFQSTLSKQTIMCYMTLSKNHFTNYFKRLSFKFAKHPLYKKTKKSGSTTVPFLASVLCAFLIYVVRLDHRLIESVE